MNQRRNEPVCGGERGGPRVRVVRALEHGDCGGAEKRDDGRRVVAHEGWRRRRCG
jgi:hypothetical protein